MAGMGWAGLSSPIVDVLSDPPGAVTTPFSTIKYDSVTFKKRWFVGSVQNESGDR